MERADDCSSDEIKAFCVDFSARHTREHVRDCGK